MKYKMKIKNNFFLLMQLLSFIVIFNACSNSSDDESVNAILPQITTNNAENIAGVKVTLGGTITSNGNSDIIRYGVCWGLTTDPIIANNNFKEEYNNRIGNFSFNLVNDLEQNKLYYVRAYCQNSVGIQYGQTISFTTEQIIGILNPMNILTTKVQFIGVISQPSNLTSDVGFVFSPYPNPTINDNKISTYVLGSDQFELNVQNLTKNTTYYVRAYTPNNSGGYYYSEEKQFRTTGYNGPAGGYVAFDKGEIVDGWRYLEIYPISLNYNILNTPGAQWGTYGQFISGILPDFGKGLENTTIIVNNTTQGNCAAKLCYNFVQNGFSDWFLPSSEEMLLISNSLHKGNISIGNYAWTSTQNGADYAFSTEYENSSIGFVLFANNPKNFNNLNVFPVRRY
jgi:hypothetical protein